VEPDRGNKAGSNTPKMQRSFIMRTFMKYAAVAAFAGALAVASAVPSQARSWHHNRYNGVGVGAGFVAGALLGAAVVNNGYYDGQGYYEPGYAYGPDYGAYAYEPAPGYGASRSYYYGRTNAQKCGQSPASTNYVPCN
jgi:hypothetical protein